MLMFAEVLKKARGEQNISLYELARRTGYTLTAFSNYEKGRRIPKLDAACMMVLCVATLQHRTELNRSSNRRLNLHQ